MKEKILKHYLEFGTYTYPGLYQEKLKIDNLARLIQKPDENFDELVKIWETDKDFRLLTGGSL